MPSIFAHPPFVGRLDAKAAALKTATVSQLESIARVAPILIDASAAAAIESLLPPNCEYWVRLDESDSTADTAIRFLDAGASRVVTRNASACIGLVPLDSLLLEIDSETSTLLAEPDVLQAIAGVLVDLPASSPSSEAELQTQQQLLASFRQALGGKRSIDSKLLLFTLQPNSSIESAIALAKLDAKALPALPLSSLAPAATDAPSAAAASVAQLFTSTLKTDRTDGLFATLVTSDSGESLGLVYSSAASIAMSIQTGDATYYSRSRNSLWKKGETSGATQRVSRIRMDCDADALQFEVDQKQGTGFCHTLRSSSCFGPASGLPALEETIESRIESAPKGSYTARLLSDAKMLNAKIREEADELCRADNKADIAAEAADLLYFALVKCLSNGVSLQDIGAVLDKRACKVTRRPGHAKAAFVQQEAEASSSKTSSASTGLATTQNSVGSDDRRQEAMVKGLEATTKPLPIASVSSPLPPKANGTLSAAAGAEGDKIVPLRYSLKNVDATGREALLQRPLASSADMIGRVQPIINAIRENGDTALRGYIKNFDRCSQIDDSSYAHVLQAPFDERLMAIDAITKQNIDRAFANIYAFHNAQMDKERTPMVVETMPGVVCTRFIQPIDRVGLYVPGGTAVLPSTALMLGVPALIAGCKHISLASPPGPDGNIRPEIVYIANKCGVRQIVKAGGAQAVAAMAYGTQTVGKVDKVFGPGNQWVTAAKMAVSMDSTAGVAIDMPAGPSEVLVIADSSCNPAFVAADLLSQAEHGPDSQVVLLAIDLPAQQLAEIEREINDQAHALPRVEIARVAISKSLIVECSTLEQAMDFSNDYAPEHLILHLAAAREALKTVRNAGSVFVGHFSPESCGDYASGTNHTLPTAGYARQYSGVSTLSFCKHITSQELSPEGLRDLGPVVEQLAELEGLQAHRNAVTVRLQKLGMK